jgi:metal-dependent amidase/aminoacylase/carboxypeptidase family protein
MSPATTTPAEAAPAGLSHLLPDLQALDIDIHVQPELSMQETSTAGVAAERLRAAGYDEDVRTRVLAALAWLAA